MLAWPMLSCGVCPSVCHVRVRLLKRENLKLFPLSNHTTVVFSVPNFIAIFRWGPCNGGGGRMQMWCDVKNRDSTRAARHNFRKFLLRSPTKARLRISSSSQQHNHRLSSRRGRRNAKTKEMKLAVITATKHVGRRVRSVGECAWLQVKHRNHRDKSVCTGTTTLSITAVDACDASTKHVLH